ncbi:DUF7576 family protein [Salinilacihabitans rarus]|uniref:DUF7576 family protein n=1 Tax=Salinilacihabitans rarus TaxID=2961596 RepID=UPI0020C8D2B0|nr:hypothetical protein [Salinilacihabitans rarus]
MVDSNADDPSPRCATCGDRIAADGRRRVETTVEDGEVVYRQFCDETCLAAWERV